MNKLNLYGLRVSYYTGKMEAYLRYKGIDYELIPMSRKAYDHIEEKTGAAQMPAVELPDGRFMTDTTPMIAWFEQQYPNNPVVPADAVVAFVGHLLEDYFEEWLWRPAMHYRWSYKTSRMHLSRKIADEFDFQLPLPAFVMRAVLRKRQQGKYVERDGVCAKTWDHVESIYLKTLERLEIIFAKRPYLLGDRPSIADFGLFASMFRHFSQDPTASDLMRLKAPAVFEWQARLWNEQAHEKVSWVKELPCDLQSILDDAGEAYLPYLNSNARAWQQGLERFDHETQGVHYQKVPVSQYRVWCLEELQRKARAVPQEDQERLKELLSARGCWAPLFELANPDSRYDGDNVPFRGSRVHYDNRP